MIRGAEELKMYFENEEYKNSFDNTRKNPIHEQQKNITEDRNDIYSILEANTTRNNKIARLNESIKKSLVFESIYNIFNRALGFQLESENIEPLKRTLVTKFIEEQGANNLLGSFKKKSYMLAEFYRIINTHLDIIKEAVKDQNEDAFELDLDMKNSFLEDFNTEDVDQLVNNIKTRVTTNIEEFVNQNVKDQMEIKDIIQQCQEKIQSQPNMSENMQESYEMLSKEKIDKVRYGRKRNIVECMVSNIATSVMINESLQNIYYENEKLNMDKVVDTATVMYTFLETMNTAKIMKIDESYIKSVLNGLK